MDDLILVLLRDLFEIYTVFSLYSFPIIWNEFEIIRVIWLIFFIFWFKEEFLALMLEKFGLEIWGLLLRTGWHWVLLWFFDKKELGLSYWKSSLWRKPFLIVGQLIFDFNHCFFLPYFFLLVQSALLLSLLTCFRFWRALLCWIVFSLPFPFGG